MSTMESLDELLDTAEANEMNEFATDSIMYTDVDVVTTDDVRNAMLDNERVEVIAVDVPKPKAKKVSKPKAKAPKPKAKAKAKPKAKAPKTVEPVVEPVVEHPYAGQNVTGHDEGAMLPATMTAQFVKTGQIKIGVNAAIKRAADRGYTVTVRQLRNKVSNFLAQPYVKEGYLDADGNVCPLGAAGMFTVSVVGNGGAACIVARRAEDAPKPLRMFSLKGRPTPLARAIAKAGSAHADLGLTKTEVKAIISAVG